MEYVVICGEKDSNCLRVGSTTGDVSHHVRRLQRREGAQIGVLAVFEADYLGFASLVRDRLRVYRMDGTYSWFRCPLACVTETVEGLLTHMEHMRRTLIPVVLLAWPSA
jgi:hypothetical protein